MKNALNKIKLTFKKWLFSKPSKLPVGINEFQEWSDSIINTYGFPDNDSLRFSLAVMVLHLDAKVDSMPKAYFARCLHKAMSNQVVSQVIQDLKTKQQEEAAKAAQQSAEVPATPAEASDEQQVSH